MSVSQNDLRHEQGSLRRLLAIRAAWLGMDANPAAIGFAGSVQGIIILHAAFIAALALNGFSPSRLGLILAGLGAIAVFPAHRLRVIALSTLAQFLVEPARFELGHLAGKAASGSGITLGGLGMTGIKLAAAIAFIAFSLAALAYIRRFRTSFPARRTLTTLLIMAAALLVLADARLFGPVGQTLLWTMIAVSFSSFWYLAYALADHRGKEARPAYLRVGLFRPFWGGTLTPFGKGANYLEKFEAKNSEELAVTRLKALKLVVWGTLLLFAHAGLGKFLHGGDFLAIPTFDDNLRQHMSGAAVAVSSSWLGLVVYYFLDILSIAAWGHVLVSVIRMAGYRIPRNTVRPLESRTLTEFWNRYYYYFKELLVDMFFYPVFRQLSGASPRVRIAVATVSAAFVGNVIYHFMREIGLVAERGLLPAIYAFQNYAFYAAVLAVGLVISQLRGRKHHPSEGVWRYHVAPRLGVGVFFCLLHVFDDPHGIGTLSDRFSYFFHLFGVAE